MKQNKDNVLVVQHIIKEFWKGNLNQYDNFIDKDIQVHCPDSWQHIHASEIENNANTKIIDQEYAKAFHFKDVNIGDVIADKDKVSARWQAEGVHHRDFFSVPASYRPFAISGQTIYRFEEGKVTEVWQSWDMLGLMKQLGFQVKPPLKPIKNLDKYLKKAPTLSEREKECLRYFLQGKTSKETAVMCFLSHRTIEYYFENIKDKLGCSNKREIFRLARILESYNLL